MRRYLQKMSTSMDGEDAIVFCILDKETGVCGYTWFIESHRTSFYIKSTYKPLQTMQVSIHGPDPDHVGKQHFRFDFTTPEEARKAINAGGGWSPFGNPMPWYFTGRRVNKRTVQLARFPTAVPVPILARQFWGWLTAEDSLPNMSLFSFAERAWPVWVREQWTAQVTAARKAFDERVRGEGVSRGDD